MDPCKIYIVGYTFLCIHFIRANKSGVFPYWVCLHADFTDGTDHSCSDAAGKTAQTLQQNSERNKTEYQSETCSGARTIGLKDGGP